MRTREVKLEDMKVEYSLSRRLVLEARQELSSGSLDKAGDTLQPTEISTVSAEHFHQIQTVLAAGQTGGVRRTRLISVWRLVERSVAGAAWVTTIAARQRNPTVRVCTLRCRRETRAESRQPTSPE